VAAQIFFILMAKNKEQKKEIYRNLSEKIKKAKSIIFAGFNALGVKDNEALRERLRQEKNDYYVAKKTLMTLAFKEQKIDINVRDFAGKVAAVFAYEDEVSPAKILGNFRQDKEKENKLAFLGGFLDGKILSKEEVEALAKLPGKAQLYAQAVGSLKAPLNGLTNVLAGNLRALLYALDAIGKSRTA